MCLVYITTENEFIEIKSILTTQSVIGVAIKFATKFYNSHKNMMNFALLSSLKLRTSKE